MKKRRLKKWVKVVLLLLAIGGFVLLMNLFGKYEDNELQNCINAGHSQGYCEKGLK